MDISTQKGNVKRLKRYITSDKKPKNGRKFQNLGGKYHFATESPPIEITKL